MKFRQLKVFAMVAEEGNMTKAAQKLYMTQPAVSHMIHDLEEELDIRLFDRIGKKIYLNAYGRQFLNKTHQVLNGYEDLKNGSLSPTIRIGSSITIANYWLPEILQEAKSIGIKIMVEVASSEEVYDKLTRNELDIALVEGILQDEGMIQVPFSAYDLHAVCGIQYPYADKQSISLQELCEEPLYLREKGSAIREVFDAALHLANLSVTPIYTSVNSQAIISSMKAGLGMSILPDLLVQKESAIRSLKIDGITLRNINRLMYRKDKYIGEELKALIDVITRKKEPY